MEGDKRLWQNRQFILGLIFGLAIVSIVTLVIFLAAKTANSNIEINNGAANEEAISDQNAVTGGPATETVTNPAINTFELKKDATICKEGDKPVIYLFSASWCPHCQWIQDTFNRVISEYVAAGKISAYHFDTESGDDLLTSATEKQLPAAASAIYSEFSPQGSVPTFVFGCKYFRIGNGYENEDSLANEEKEFKAVIEELIK